MRSHMLRNNVLGAALACAFAAAPLSQALAQGADGQMQKSAASQTDNQTIPDKAADAWITTKVKAELATTKNVSASDINVETSDSKVTLSGVVSTSNEKTHAVAKAKAVKGVKSVNASNLRVNAMHADSSMDKAEHTMSAGDTSAPAMAAGSNGNMHKSAENHMDNQTVPDKAADAWITTKVKTELATAVGHGAQQEREDERGEESQGSERREKRGCQQPEGRHRGTGEQHAQRRPSDVGHASAQFNCGSLIDPGISREGRGPVGPLPFSCWLAACSQCALSQDHAGRSVT